MKRARDFLLCLSFANLCFLDLWDTVAMKSEASLAGVLIALVVTAILMWAALPLARRWPVLRWIGVAALLLPVNLFRVHALHLHRQDVPRLVWLLAGLLIGFSLIRRRAQIVRLPELIAIIFVPLLPIQAGYAWWQLAHPPSYVERTPAPLVAPPRISQRVIWLIFDELDQAGRIGEMALALEHPGIQIGCVHANEHLTGLHRIALANRDLAHVAGNLGLYRRLADGLHRAGNRQPARQLHFFPPVRRFTT
jgi:hypothetical protein